MKQRQLTPRSDTMLRHYTPRSRGWSACSQFTIATLPSHAPLQCMFLFAEARRYLYVGRTRRQSLRKRLRQHSIDSAKHNRQCLTFKIVVR